MPLAEVEKQGRRQIGKKNYPGNRTVAMFRDPRRRLWSAFNYFKHTNGMPHDLREKMLNNSNTVKEFAAFPGIAGCQTKMVLGQRCSRNVPLTAAKLQVAKRRLRERFAFIGLTEEWNDSVCLFHAMFGKTPVSVAFQNVRPSKEVSRDYDPDRALRELSPQDDPWDYELWVDLLLWRRLLLSDDACRT